MAKRFRQYAALPWRDTGHGIEVLLITSRETRRWVIPKGWPMPGLTPVEAAAREAFEEAGAGGVVSRNPIGRYAYDKRMKDGSILPVEVEVYGLEAMVRHPSWPEQGQRSERWFRPAEAVELVAEPGLKKIIQSLACKPR